VGASFSGFSKTPEYEWLMQNAYKYGFIISYPKDNAYYQFEPWHWRFVGKSLAKRLNEEKQNFYDLEQRTIDSYLINIFD
jgi:D-alanyl-D-alanine carboxypeptidase